ncbi:MAG: SlyX family protein [Reinekea sp.]|jgi:SlyX protein
MNNQDQLIELETRLTHLDDTVEQLNEIIANQQITLAKMEKLIRKLADEHIEMKEQLAPEIVNTRPPHY